VSIRKLVSFLILLSLVLSACSDRSSSTTKSGLQILASTSILADITRNVTGETVHVASLLPVGADPHAYEASPTDVVQISESNVLIINGLEYERFIEPLLANADGKRRVIVASNGIEPRKTEADGVDDPHMWLDPNLVIKYVENIRDGLIQAAPEGAQTYEANAGAYIAQLKDLDTWITAQVAQIPAERRILVTNHEALGYFAERYGFKIAGTVIPSLSSEAATSAQGMAAVIDQIRATNAPAIFLGEVENPALAEQIAAETGAKVINDLYLESLTDGPPAGTYIDMMKYNVSKIVEALK
jgi:ABC-type Zn uptake system ZnuABC Zn-binding protein ZnuA